MNIDLPYCARSQKYRLLLLALLIPFSFAKASEYGRFSEKLQIEKYEEGADSHSFRLLDDFTYFDPSGREWTAPKSVIVNGASIPKPFWSLIGGPWSGNYTEAAVIHDHFCVTKSRPWKEVHRAFYDAMLANGVSSVKAKIMYFAVYRFGPRWTQSEKALSACFASYCLEEEQLSEGEVVLKDIGLGRGVRLSECGSCFETEHYAGRFVLQPEVDVYQFQSVVDRLRREDITLDELDRIAASQFGLEIGEGGDHIPDQIKELMLELELVK